MATLSTPNDSVVLEIGNRLDAAPVGRTHYRVVLAVGLGLFFEMYEIFLSSTISATLKTQYSLGGTELKVLLASSFLGMFVGAAFLGRLADIFGRRRAFMFNLIWFSVWSLIAAFAPGPGFLVVARFLAGIGVGAEYPVADSYLSDVLPKSHRGRLAAWAYTCSYLAVPFLGFLSLGLTDRHIFGVAGWRVLLALGALGAVLVALLRRGLPESPRWLAGTGRIEEARAAVACFESPQPVSPHRASDGASRVHAEQGGAKNGTDVPSHISKPLARLSTPPYRRRLMMLIVFHLFQTFGYYGFGTMASLVLVHRGYDVTSSLLFVACSFLGYPVGSILAIPLLGIVKIVCDNVESLAPLGHLLGHHKKNRKHK